MKSLWQHFVVACGKIRFPDFIDKFQSYPVSKVAQLLECLSAERQVAAGSILLYNQHLHVYLFS